MKTQRIALLSLALFLPTTACTSGTETPLSPGSAVESGVRIGGSEAANGPCGPLADTGWPTLHGDCRNSDYSDSPVAASFEAGWYAPDLANSVVLTGASVDEDAELVYATTGKKNQPNLWAIERSTGITRWRSAPWNEHSASISGPDLCASTSQAIIDVDQNVYLGDCRYLWSYDVDGNLRFKAPLSVQPGAESAPFITAFFTVSGEVGGITTDGRVLIFDRNPPTVDGRQIASLQLPGLAQSERRLEPGLETCLWKGVADEYMLDPDIALSYLAGFLGSGGGALVNTPAIVADTTNPRVTRIYAPALLADPATYGDPDVPDARLLRIDFDPDTTTLSVVSGYNGRLADGNGTAASPAISENGQRIYQTDAAGNLYAFNADSGDILWGPHYIGQVFGSVTAVPRPRGETVYAFATDCNVSPCQDLLVAVDGRSGQPIFTRTFESLAEHLDPLIGHIRRAMPSTWITAGPEGLVVGFTIGYTLSPNMPFADEPNFVWPMESVVLSLDFNGQIRGDLTPLRDTSEVAAMRDKDGNIFVGLAGTMSSVAHCIAETVDRGRLPPPMAPTAGLQMLTPTP